ncbi:hypothetical protein D910_07348 [Dendroctonus ponderosae]
MSLQEEISEADNSPNGDIFQQKKKPKALRVLTVMAYVLSVSMAAILLSIYYIFMWQGRPHIGAFGTGAVAHPEYLIQPNNTHESHIFGTLQESTLGPINQKSARNETFRMSCKSNGIKLTKCDSQQWKTATILEPPSVKFAGEEAKDRLYEPKHKKKIVRVLTVVAYVFFVSLAAIMLSMYYVFLWNGTQRVAAKLVAKQQNFSGNKCEIVLAEIQRQIRLMESMRTTTTTTTTTERPTSPIPDMNLKWKDEDFSDLEDTRKNSFFLNKLLKEYPYPSLD